MTWEDNAEMRLAESFAEIARTLLAESKLQPTLARIVLLAAATVDGCEQAGISFVEGQRITCPAASGDIPLIVDRMQMTTGEGPCLDAIRDHAVFLTGALSAEHRWPNFSRRAHSETGVESVLSIRLFADEETLGALNMYSTKLDAFDDHDIAIGSVFAAHAAVAVSTAQERDRLWEAIESRDIIGRAKGILMERERLTDDEAFDVLKRASQRMNVKLRAIAETIATSTTPAAAQHII